MFRKLVRRVGASVLLAAFAQPVMAQGIPNPGNYLGLTAPFRVGVQVENAANGFTAQQAFEQATIDDITDFLDPFALAQVVGAVNAQQAAITGVFDLRGATAIGTYAQNGSALSIVFVAPDGSVINGADGAPCSFTFNGATRQQSFDEFDTLTDPDVNSTDPRSSAIFACLYQSFARFSPIDPLVGNPGSLQASLLRNAMDLSIGDSLIEQGEGAPGDPWTVGATYSGGNAGRFDYERFEGRIQRSFRIFEGNRAQLKFDLPIQYSRIAGADNYSVQLGVGLEMPVIAKRWSIEPRVSYGAVYSEDLGSAGHILQASVTSRAVFDGIGRGRVVLGNMVAYSTTLSVPGLELRFNPDITNVSFRNGVAYELPIKARVGGRNSSLRASYTNTQLTGDELRNDNFHEFTLSFGLRGREESVRAARDLIRFNANATIANGFESFSAGVGFRF